MDRFPHQIKLVSHYESNIVTQTHASSNKDSAILDFAQCFVISPSTMSAKSHSEASWGQ